MKTWKFHASLSPSFPFVPVPLSPFPLHFSLLLIPSSSTPLIPLCFSFLLSLSIFHSVIVFHPSIPSLSASLFRPPRSPFFVHPRLPATCSLPLLYPSFLSLPLPSPTFLPFPLRLAVSLARKPPATCR